MTFYKKTKAYEKVYAQHNTVEENAALAFELIAKKINQAEELYAQKQFEAAAKKAQETIDLCAALSTIFIDDTMEQPISVRDKEAMTINWEIYFLELMRTITSLFIDHNAQKKEKLLKSLQTMAELWRSFDSKSPSTIIEQQNSSENLNLNV